MLKTKTIHAVSVALEPGVDAVFVQEGDDWCTLREYRCISPQEFLNCRLIVAPEPSTSGSFSRLINEAFGRLPEGCIVMASPHLAAALKATSDAGAKQSATTEKAATAQQGAAA